MNLLHNDENIFDAEGYRYNVGIIILNNCYQVFWAKRKGQDAWQFPQGGINAGESCLEAMYRELFEETGLKKEDVVLLGRTKHWLSYRLPARYRRRRTSRYMQCIGQRQRWYLLQLHNHSENIDLNKANSQEFEQWKWIDYWTALEHIVYFKRAVYKKAMCELAELIPTLQQDKLVLATTKRKSQYFLKQK